MKRYIVLSFSLLAIIAITVSCSSSKKNQKDTNETDSITKMILDTNFVFHARNANPIAGSMIILNYDYTFSIDPDSVVAWLPYFGRGFSAPMNPSDGGIKFTSTKFKYDIKPNKKQNMYQIHIVPKDLTMFASVRDVQQIWLNVGTSGYASLQIVSNMRTPISFTGTISSK